MADVKIEKCPEVIGPQNVKHDSKICSPCTRISGESVKVLDGLCHKIPHKKKSKRRRY